MFSVRYIVNRNRGAGYFIVIYHRIKKEIVIKFLTFNFVFKIFLKFFSVQNSCETFFPNTEFLPFIRFHQCQQIPVFVKINFEKQTIQIFKSMIICNNSMVFINRPNRIRRIFQKGFKCRFYVR